MIRKAAQKDIPSLLSLLSQVLEIHAQGRSDVFKLGRTKYTEQELSLILHNEKTPVFVSENERGEILGYAFCVQEEIANDNILQDCKYLYIDDLCVNKNQRRKGIGKELFAFVSAYAQETGCTQIRLNVWALNESAMRFYEKCGFSPLKTLMQKNI